MMGGRRGGRNRDEAGGPGRRFGGRHRQPRAAGRPSSIGGQTEEPVRCGSRNRASDRASWAARTVLRAVDRRRRRHHVRLRPIDRNRERAGAAARHRTSGGLLEPSVAGDPHGGALAGLVRSRHLVRHAGLRDVPKGGRAGLLCGHFRMHVRRSARRVQSAGAGHLGGGVGDGGGAVICDLVLLRARELAARARRCRDRRCPGPSHSHRPVTGGPHRGDVWAARRARRVDPARWVDLRGRLPARSTAAGTQGSAWSDGRYVDDRSGCIRSAGGTLPGLAPADVRGVPAEHRTGEVTRATGLGGPGATGELAGYIGSLAVVPTLVCIGAALVRPSRLRRSLIVLLVPLGLSMAAFGVLEADWMRQYRFATAVWPLGALAGTLAAAHVLPRLAIRGRALVAALASAAAVVSGIGLADGARAFRANPTVPLCLVAQEAGYNINAYARIVGRPDATILAPDIGGVALTSTLKIIDLAGLTDARMARYWQDKDWTGLRDYVFDEARPTFITTHGYWSSATGLP